MRKKHSLHLVSFTLVFSLLFTGTEAYANTAVKETKVDQISLNKSSLTLAIRETDTLTVTTASADGDYQAVKWTSSNLKVAKVSNGAVTGVNEGSAIITASTEDGRYKATCTIRVYSDGIVTFKDENLEKAVRAAVNISTGNLFRRNVANITYLDASNRLIGDISGIENLMSLTHLELYCNEISDIKPLSSLTDLQVLDLNGNKINDISGLKDLSNLRTIDLSCNQVKDISVLKGLKNLTDIDLYLNQITDISSLTGLTNLRYLDFKDNNVRISDPRYLKAACLITLCNKAALPLESLKCWN